MALAQGRTYVKIFGCNTPKLYLLEFLHPFRIFIMALKSAAAQRTRKLTSISKLAFGYSAANALRTFRTHSSPCSFWGSELIVLSGFLQADLCHTCIQLVMVNILNINDPMSLPRKNVDHFFSEGVGGTLLWKRIACHDNCLCAHGILTLL